MFHMLNSRMVRIDTYCLMVSDWQTCLTAEVAVSTQGPRNLAIWRFISNQTWGTLKPTELESTSFFCFSTHGLGMLGVLSGNL